jgi:hypothetical protein
VSAAPSTRDVTAASAVSAPEIPGAKGVARAYGWRVVGRPSDTTEGLRSSVVRGRPNWWVILAVSLGLMALLVATAGGGRHAPDPTGRLSPAADSAARGQAGDGASSSVDGAGSGGTRGATASTSGGRARQKSGGTRSPAAPTTTTTATATGHPSAGALGAGGTSLTAHLGTSGGTATPSPAPALPVSPATTTTLPVTTTTVVATAGRQQAQGLLAPPAQRSAQFSFTGAGTMQVSVVWSGSTYLTLTVSCPSGSQSVGGTAAMQATVPGATGTCLATVSEPSTESVSLTFSISWGPVGG